VVTDCHRLEFVSPDGKIAGDARKQLEKKPIKMLLVRQIIYQKIKRNLY